MQDIVVVGITHFLYLCPSVNVAFSRNRQTKVISSTYYCCNSFFTLRVFGCEAYVHVPKTLRKKLDYKCRKCIFLGYGIDGQFGYRLWDPDTRTVVRSSDVVFYENKMHKQSVKEVEVRKVVFKDIMPSVDVKQKKSLDVDASTCDQSRKTVIGQYDDAQNDDAQHNDVQNDDFQQEYAQNDDV